MMTKEQYLMNASVAVDSYAIDITNFLIEINNTGMLTEESRDTLYLLIEQQEEADRAVLGYDIANIGEEYQALHGGICSLCSDDLRLIQLIKESIEKGSVPSKELIKYYVDLRGENYQWVIKELAEEYLKLGVEQMLDL